jgi:hypothetical protein
MTTGRINQVSQVRAHRGQRPRSRGTEASRWKLTPSQRVVRNNRRPPRELGATRCQAYAVTAKQQDSVRHLKEAARHRDPFAFVALRW